ncbi:unnamed protein product [Moneuplotes crassus]|uniref:Uncharacterized protein n=1 Tax=Euplotes crassus TaxID=5936 RepID=A0AAD1XCF7_EUPCR|nr:unnamed protein product [Moneuplotes crassus]
MSEYYYDQEIRPSIMSRISEVQVEETVEEIPSSRDTCDYIQSSINEDVVVQGANIYDRYFRIGGNRESFSRIQQKSRGSTPEEELSEDLCFSPKKQVEDALDTPKSALSSNHDLSFDQNYEYDETPQIIRKNVSPSCEEKIEFEARSPEEKLHHPKPDFINSSLTKDQKTSARESPQSLKKKITKPKKKRKKTKKTKSLVKTSTSGFRNAKILDSLRPQSPDTNLSKFSKHIYSAEKKFLSDGILKQAKKLKAMKTQPASANKATKTKNSKKIDRSRPKESTGVSTLKFTTQDGRTSMRSTFDAARASITEGNEDMGMSRSSFTGASKGKMSIQPDNIHAIPEKMIKKRKKKGKKKRKLRLKRPGTSTGRVGRDMAVTPSRSTIIYDFNDYGDEIIKKETIHEYQERPYSSNKIKKHRRNATKVFKDWDTPKCRRNREFNKVMRDAWDNINNKGYLKTIDNSHTTPEL